MPSPALSKRPPLRATLLRCHEVARDQLEVVLEVPEAIVAAHTAPGQYVSLGAEDARGEHLEGLFAMWNRPGEEARTLRFLLRRNAPEGGELAALLARAEEGRALSISPPMGAGFPLERARGRHLAFVATGTAYAPIAACIAQHLAHPTGALGVSLDLGIRSPAHVASEAELARFRRAGVDVHLDLSRPTDDGVPHGTLAQDALLDRLLAEGRLADTLILAAGHDAMLASLRARHLALGGDPSLVASNL